MTRKNQNPVSALLNSVGTALAPSPARQGGNSKPKNKQQRPRVANPTSTASWAAPSASSTVIRTPNKMRYKCVTYERFEAVGPITGTTTPFAIAGNYSVNPGLAVPFPWMSIGAAAFNMYKFRRLRIHYKNSTGTTNTGVVVIGYNPDPNDIAPTTLQQIENYETRVRVATWEDSYVDVPADDLARLKKFFVRTSIVPGEIDTYDVGTIFVGVSGNNSSTATLGEVWLEYILDMYAPVTAAMSTPYAKASSVYTQTANVPFTSGTQAIIPFNSVLGNPMGLINNNGVFTGITGALIVYAQVSISTTSFTSGNINILKNGTPVITAVYPTPNPTVTAGYATANIEGFVVLMPTDTLSVGVGITGAGNAAPVTGAVQTSILVLSAA